MLLLLWGKIKKVWEFFGQESYYDTRVIYIFMYNEE